MQNPSPHRAAQTTLAQATALWLLLAMVMPLDAASVLIATGDGTGNTTAPAADPGFANVGAIGDLSGVYLRNGWVLTANHVGANSIILLGITHEPIAGSRVRFQNADLSFADLIAYKLQTKPALSDLQITSGAPVFNTLVTLIGNGRDRAATTSYSGIDGWFWGSTRSLRWGTNRIAFADEFIFDTQSFVTQFDDITGGPPGQHEADLINGDSGGGAFTGSGASAELMGIIFARAPLAGQPPGTSIYGDHGVIVDLFAYRSDIIALIDQPDCSNGLDDDGDGQTDFPNDPGCLDALDSNERGASYECDNGIDDDGDGFLDFPDDDGCESPTDDSEFIVPVPTGLLGASLFGLYALGRVARASRPGSHSVSAGF